MNTARIVVLAIALCAGGAVAYPSERPGTATRVTGAIAQARQTGTQAPTLQSIADGYLASEAGNRASGRVESVSVAPWHSDSGHDPETTMRNQT
jgi:hypothetical protein